MSLKMIKCIRTDGHSIAIRTDDVRLIYVGQLADDAGPIPGVAQPGDWCVFADTIYATGFLLRACKFADEAEAVFDAVLRSAELV